MQHFDVVVFDVDGTLLDTSEGVLASVKYTIKEHETTTYNNDEIISQYPKAGTKVKKNQIINPLSRIRRTG